MPDPGTHFDGKLDIQKNGYAVYTSGPFEIDDDMHSIRVVAVVTQQPQDDFVEGKESPTAICHGDVHLDAAKLAALPGTQGRWDFSADVPAGGTPFQQGWARGTALALVVKKNGEIETYSWSQWVWLVRP